jgi:hypothetical protein
MLGHANLDSTEVYTRVSIKKLAAIHAATHPGAKLERPREQVAERPPGSAGTSTMEENFSSLAADLRREDDADSGG